MILTGNIAEWNSERGFGYLVSDNRRIFLHIRDFKARYKHPEVGDVIYFVVGADKEGRTCAKEAVQATTFGRVKAVHFLILLFLVLPFSAVYHVLGSMGLVYTGVWFTLISVVTYFFYALDKYQAQEGGWRESERQLHLLELLGGWPGAFFAQRCLRHKSSKESYLFVFILVIGLHQFLAIDALRGWPLVRVVTEAIRQL